MSLRHGTAVVLCMALLSTHLAMAQPHSPPPRWKDPAGEPVPVDEWLGRLVGRYQVDGMIEVPDRCIPPPPPPDGSPPPFFTPLCSNVSGMADCAPVGAGPGIHCIFNMQWTDLHELVYPSETERGGMFAVPGGVSNLAPSMALLGIDPARSALNFLLVDNKGLAEGGSGGLRGGRATIISTCVNEKTLYQAMREPPPPPEECRRTTLIEAREGDRFVRFMIQIEINDDLYTRYELALRRVNPGPAAATPGRQRSSR